MSVSCKYLQIDDYSLVKFSPLDITNEESVGNLMYEIDNAIQYGEDLEPKEMPVRNLACNVYCYYVVVQFHTSSLTSLLHVNAMFIT